METSNSVPRCHNCKFWQGNRKAAQGQGVCHRMPIQIAGLVPQQNMAGQTVPVAISGFPSAPAMQWCGEHVLEVVLQ